MFRLDLGDEASRCDGVTRRSFLSIGLTGLAALGLPNLAQLRAASDSPRRTSVILLWIDGGPKALLVGAWMLCFLIIIRHRSNIRRMWNGTEPRAGEKHPDKPKDSRTARQHG